MKKSLKPAVLLATLLIWLPTCAFSQQIKPLRLLDSLACFDAAGIKQLRKLKERVLFLEQLRTDQQFLIENLEQTIQEQSAQVDFYRFQVENSAAMVATLRQKEDRYAQLNQRLAAQLQAEQRKRKRWIGGSTGMVVLIALAGLAW